MFEKCIKTCGSLMSFHIRRIAVVLIVPSEYEVQVRTESKEHPKMASKTLLFLLGLTIIAVAYGAWVEEAEDESEELTVEEVLEYFSPMEKRGRKGSVGPCTDPRGKACKICNLKIKNKNDRRRYMQC